MTEHPNNELQEIVDYMERPYGDEEYGDLFDERMDLGYDEDE